MLVLTLIPAVALLAGAFLIRGHARVGWREAMLASAVGAGVFVTVATEGLGLASAFSFGPVLSVWLLATGAAAACAWRVRARWELSSLREAWAVASGLKWVGVSMAAATAVAAFFGAPSTWDSMTYHLARVAHWIQNRHVDFYPTHIERQAYRAPFAEYAIAHLMILGGDRLSGFVQWFAMLMSACATSLIARDLGGSPRAEAVAALFGMTLPMGVLQASSTQNDYVVAFFVLATVYSALKLWREPRPGWLVICGAAAGLAALTKGTAYVVACPFLLAFGGALLVRHRVCALRYVGCVGAVALALNLPHYARCVSVYGTPLAELNAGNEEKLASGSLRPVQIASNVVRNAAAHFVATPFHYVNKRAAGFVERTHRVLALDVEGPKTARGFQYSAIRAWAHEDIAGNPLHAIVAALLAGPLIYRAARRRAPADVIAYATATAIAAVLLLAALRWQPWTSRLQLPLFVLAAPIVGVILDGFPSRVPSIVAGVLALAAVPYVAMNESRPLLGSQSVFTMPREAQYFRRARRWRPTTARRSRTHGRWARGTLASSSGRTTGSIRCGCSRGGTCWFLTQASRIARRADPRSTPRLRGASSVRTCGAPASSFVRVGNARPPWKVALTFYGP